MNAIERGKAAWPWAVTPQRLFFGFALLHLAAWTIIPTLFSPNAPLDVIEGYVWGREWLIGTYKHPPMQAWWLEILAMVTGRAPFAHFLASQIAVVVAFWAVWQTGRRLTDEPAALLGVLLLEGVAYYNFTTPEFNPNVLQLPFFALMAWSFHRGVKDNRLTDWLLLGVWAAAGMYSKYTALIPIGLLGLLLLGTRIGRRRIGSLGPWLALAVFALLFAPHLVWLDAHGWQPFAYTESRIDHAAQWRQYLWQPFRFLLGQFGIVLAAVLLLALISGGRREPAGEKRFDPFDRAFLLAMAWGPVAVVVLLSLVGGMKLRDMWGSLLWNFIGLWAVITVRPALTVAGWRRFAAGWGFVFLLGLTLHTAFDVLGPAATHKGKRVHFPGQALSQHLAEVWQTRYHRPLAYVVGDTWLAGNVAYYAPATSTASRPQALMMGDFTISPWIDRNDLRRQGGVLVWCSDHCRDRAATQTIPLALNGVFPYAVLQQPLTLKWQTETALPPAMVGWAILPPEENASPP